MAGKTKPKSATGTVQRRSYERAIDELIAITPVEYGGLQAAYDHFNAALFGGRLSDVFITYQRKSHSRGYFAPERFSGRTIELGKGELALNPDAFVDRTDKQIASTLVHEMVHVCQHAFGKPSPRGYHNKEWAAQMKAIGLQPSNTGAVGGKETGQQMAHYIVPGRPFDVAYDKLAATGWKLNLQSAHRPGGQKAPNSKVKFTCVTCGLNVWGKPDAVVLCAECLLESNADTEIDLRPATMRAAEATALEEPAPAPKPTPLLEAPSYEPTPEPEPIKRKRGRSKGSKSKVVASQSYEQEQQPVKRRPGRPKGSKNKPKAQVVVAQSYERQAV